MVRAAVGKLFGEHADGRVRLADDGLIARAVAAFGRGAFRRAKLRHHHVVAFRDAVAGLSRDAIVHAGAVGQRLQIARVAVAAHKAGQHA
ncbi:hypothetical protein D3C87_1675840 [compost metagenome]